MKKMISLLLCCCWAMPLAAQTVATVYSTTNSPLPSNAIQCVALDTLNHRLWVGTDNGLASLDLSSNQWQIWNISNSPLPDNQIRSLAVQTTNGTLWVGTFTQGMSSYRAATNQWHSYNTNNSPLNDNFVRSIYIDAQQRKWIATSGGAAVLDTAGNWSIYFFSTPAVTLNNVTDLLLDANGQAWFTTINTGLVGMDGSDFFALTAANSGLPDNTNLAIAADPTAGLWLASPFAGLCHFVPPSTWYSYNTLNSNIPTNYLLSLRTNQLGQVLVGTANAGLVVLSPNSPQWQQINTLNSTLPSNTINGIALQSPTEAWVATDQGIALCRITAITSLPSPANSHSQQPCLSPNPVSFSRWATLPANSQTAHVQLFNSYAQNIAVPIHIDDAQYWIDTQNLPSGMYILHCADEQYKNIVKLKFIK